MTCALTQVTALLPSPINDKVTGFRENVRADLVACVLGWGDDACGMYQQHRARLGRRNPFRHPHRHAPSARAGAQPLPSVCRHVRCLDRLRQRRRRLPLSRQTHGRRCGRSPLRGHQLCGLSNPSRTVRLFTQRQQHPRRTGRTHGRPRLRHEQCLSRHLDTGWRGKLRLCYCLGLFYQ